jgi:hypothetical protein
MTDETPYQYDGMIRQALAEKAYAEATGNAAMKRAAEKRLAAARAAGRVLEPEPES